VNDINTFILTITTLHLFIHVNLN